MRQIERATGKAFGDPARPLLVSCRSGAKFSMPGMMDTVLNLGLNESVAEGLIKRTGDARFAFDLYRRLVQMFGGVVLGVPDDVFEAVITARRRKADVESDTELGAEDWREVTQKFREIVRTFAGHDFPDDPFEQLRLATEAVFKSWNGKRAIAYRNAANIPHNLGTAVNIQTMVFGNMGPDCATGVAMSRNASTGEPEPEGDYLISAQGEDVVAGIRKTQPLSDLKTPCRRATPNSSRSPSGSRSTIATCRTSSSPSSTTSSGSCRRATASEPPRPRFASPSTWSRKA